MDNKKMPCPCTLGKSGLGECGLTKTYDQCCGPYHTGTAQPPTAEALMRSRFTKEEKDYWFYKDGDII